MRTFFTSIFSVSRFTSVSTQRVQGCGLCLAPCSTRVGMMGFGLVKLGHQLILYRINEEAYSYSWCVFILLWFFPSTVHLFRYWKSGPSPNQKLTHISASYRSNEITSAALRTRRIQIWQDHDCGCCWVDCSGGESKAARSGLSLVWIKGPYLDKLIRGLGMV